MRQKAFPHGMGHSAKEWAKRYEVVFANEFACPDCWDALVADIGTPRPGICEAHQRGRRVLALSGL